MVDFETSFKQRLKGLGIPKAQLIVQNAGQETLISTSYTHELYEGGDLHTFQASCLTKPVTALAALLLINEHQIDVDSPVLEHLKTSETPVDPRFEKIKIKELLTNSAGLARGGYTNSYDSAERLLSQVLQTPLVLPPGEAYKYSNLSFYLLAELIESLQDLTFEKYVENNIFKPLALSATCFLSTVPTDKVETGSWQGQYFGSANLYRERLPAPYLPLLKGSGGLLTTLPDYLKIVHLLAGNLKGLGANLDQAVKQHRGIRFQLSKSRFALPGLYQLISAQGSFLYKMGSSSGYSSVAVIEATTNSVALVIANQVAVTRTLRYLAMEALKDLQAQNSLVSRSLKPQRAYLYGDQGNNMDIVVPEKSDAPLQVAINQLQADTLEYKPKTYLIKTDKVHSLLRLGVRKGHISEATLGPSHFEVFPDLESEQDTSNDLAGWYKSKELGLVEIYSRNGQLILDWGLADESLLLPENQGAYLMKGGPFNHEYVKITSSKSGPKGFYLGPIQFIECSEPGIPQIINHLITTNTKIKI